MLWKHPENLVRSNPAAGSATAVQAAVFFPEHQQFFSSTSTKIFMRAAGVFFCSSHQTFTENNYEF